LGLESCVCFDGAEKACGEWRVDAFEELQEDEADRVSLRQQLITARVGELGNKTLGAEFREVVAERSERVVLAGAAKRFDDGRVDFGGGEGAAGRDMREAHERMHEGQLPRVIELEAGDALSGSGDCWFCKLSQLAAIHKGLQDVLLDVEIVVVDSRHGLAESGKVFHRFVDAVIVDVVACRFCAQDEVIADILLDEAVSIMAADHGIGQVHVLDLGLQLAPIVPGDLAAEDDRDLVRLSDGSIGVKQAFAEHVECCTATKDEVVAELDLREEQPVLAAAFSRSVALKKGVRWASHFWPQVTRCRGVSESASSCRRSGAVHFKKALEHCLNRMPSSRMRLASQWC